MRMRMRMRMRRTLGGESMLGRPCWLQGERRGASVIIGTEQLPMPLRHAAVAAIESSGRLYGSGSKSSRLEAPVQGRQR